MTPTPRAAVKKKPRPPRRALQILIVLAGTQPLVWRRILVPERYTFWDLHVAIQDAMGWQDYHLYEFEIVGDPEAPPHRIGLPHPEDCGGPPGYERFLEIIFCDARPYPILDYTRGLAARLGLPIRTVDKALWQYSKEKQP